MNDDSGIVVLKYSHHVDPNATVTFDVTFDATEMKLAYGDACGHG